ncbi:MAG: glycoside hydrolase family 3 C-terminal domain-containing protein, partial [Clostridia bacterium]
TQVIEQYPLIQKAFFLKWDESEIESEITQIVDYFVAEKLITLEATCFPSASALGCSWDTDLCYEVGKAMGEEALDFGVSIILGPGVNIKRSPLCGRNFEYYSEDPVLTGEMAAGLINGIQSVGIGTCIKHFAVNNQEYRRLSVDACLSQKALFDIYLKNFEIAIKKSKPFSVMCSYNRINGQYACESKTLLTDILRNLWGFDGIVVSDWGATNDRINCLKAGMELEMPGSGGINDMKVAQAVKAGLLDEEVLNTGVLRLLKLIYKCHENKKDFKANFEEHHLLARKAAAQSAVLLKNDNLLPIKAKEKICVIGEFAKITRYQGGGSSHIISTKIDNAYDEIVKINQLSNSNEIKYAIGYKIDEPKTDYNLIENALQIAEGCDKIVVFAGLPDSFESEGYDRKTLEIPQCQNDLITALCQKNKNVIVVLYNGAPIVMPWKNQVGAILTCYLAGQAVGGAAADLLFGKSVPCGKLSETYPEKIEDTPCFLSFPGYIDSSIYTEDIFVGYRYYDKKKIQPAFSFGFG